MEPPRGWLDGHLVVDPRVRPFQIVMLDVLLDAYRMCRSWQARRWALQFDLEFRLPFLTHVELDLSRAAV